MADAVTNPEPAPVGPYGEQEYSPAEAGELIAGVLDQLDQAGERGPWNAPDYPTSVRWPNGPDGDENDNWTPHRETDG